MRHMKDSPTIDRQLVFLAPSVQPNYTSKYLQNKKEMTLYYFQYATKPSMSLLSAAATTS
jgi:hypothetical protein